MGNRVVVTGIGVISPIGTGRETFWKALLAGTNGIERISRFDPAEYAAQIAGEVKDFDPTLYIDKKESKRMDRYAQFAVAATKMAIEDAKLDLVNEDCDRIGTFIGAGIGGIETMHSQYEKLFSKGPHHISPFFKAVVTVPVNQAPNSSCINPVNLIVGKPWIKWLLLQRPQDFLPPADRIIYPYLISVHVYLNTDKVP